MTGILTLARYLAGQTATDAGGFPDGKSGFGE